jgi:hypothetical protein
MKNGVCCFYIPKLLFFKHPPVEIKKMTISPFKNKVNIMNTPYSSHLAIMNRPVLQIPRIVYFTGTQQFSINPTNPDLNTGTF